MKFEKISEKVLFIGITLRILKYKCKRIKKDCSSVVLLNIIVHGNEHHYMLVNDDSEVFSLITFFPSEVAINY